MEITEAQVEKERLMRTMAINMASAERDELVQRHGQVWDALELANDFIVTGFASPFVIVTRRSNNELGSLEFQHQPRFYFRYMPHHPEGLPHG